MGGFETGRQFLKAVEWEKARSFESDQKKGLPHPPPQRPAPEGATRFALPAPSELTLESVDLRELLGKRRSHRRYTSEALSLEALAFLLWGTQGIQQVVREGVATLRTAPSAGARHPFETYIAVHRVDGLEPGLYRYLPLEHELCLVREGALEDESVEACLGQAFVGQAAALFAWTVVPYRTEWRYGPMSHKVIAIDVGHVCQNLYLACEAIDAGTCAIGAYSQTKADRLLGVDGEDEFAIYLAPVGFPG